MKQLLFASLLGLALFSFTGCGESEQAETATMKCEANKCGAAMDKDTLPAKKCAADAKCGEGKCGDK